MDILPIRLLPDPILTRPTQPVDKVDDAVTLLIQRLVATMRRHPRCVGLAAPQVGSHLKVAVMDASGHPKATHHSGLLVLVNPTIETTHGATIQREGCLSIPDFTADVRRATHLHLRARDATGSMQTLQLQGFEAIIAQHEIDHLNGTLFLDRVANMETDVFRRKRYG